MSGFLRQSRVGRVSRIFAVASGFLFSISITAFGQTNALGNIIGVVTDESGAVLPGVTVTATSPSLQIREESDVTGPNGEYRLSALPLGTYEVTYNLEGFQTVKREEIRLTAGFTAKIDVVLKLGSLQESITVSGASPLVDVASATTQTALTRETLELIPTSRNGVQALMAQAPATRSNVDVGGNTAGAIPVFHAYGNERGAWPVIEGVAVASPSSSSGQAGVYVDYGSFDEVHVSAIGNDAETPVRGILLTSVVKSGGNTFHGSYNGAYTNPSLIANNVDASLAAQGIRGTPIEERWDTGGDLGGFAVRDKLWFYLGARRRVNNNGVLDCVKPDGSQCDTLLTQGFYDGKLTYQINNKQRLIAYYQYDSKHNITGASAFNAWESRFNQHFLGNMTKGEWQGTLGHNLLVDALVGYYDFISWQYGESVNPATYDLVTLLRTGASNLNYNTPDDVNWYRQSAKATLSWTPDKGFLGNHSLKVGWDLQRAYTEVIYPEHPQGDYLEIFRSGVPFEITIYNFPTNTHNNDTYSGAFIKDQWQTASRRLTLDLGMRVGFDRNFIPPQDKVAGQFASIYPAQSYPRIEVVSWNTVVPRLHAAYDLTGDAKTVLKGGWGRFAAMRGADEAAYMNRNTVGSTTYLWNGNLSQANLDPNGPSFVSRTGTTLGILNPNLKAPLTDEFSVSLERQLFRDIAVRVTGLYQRDTNVEEVINPLIPSSAYAVPVLAPAIGPDGKPIPGSTFTYWEYPTSLRGASFQASTQVNDPLLNATYKTFEIAAAKRFSQRWLALLSYSYTKLYVPGANAGTNPNNAIFTLNNTAEWNVKASGSYEMPFGVLTSVNYELRSGLPWQRTAFLNGGATIPTLLVGVEPLGAHRYDNLNLLDFRIRKDFQLFRTHKAGFGVDIFNLLNLSTVTSINPVSGSSYERVTTASGNTATLPFLPGRDVQFTFNYSF
jgi:hypothetical protein